MLNLKRYYNTSQRCSWTRHLLHLQQTNKCSHLRPQQLPNNGFHQLDHTIHINPFDSLNLKSQLQNR
jgi:hypothetical protein